MDDPVNLVSRVFVGGGVRSFKAPALINRHIHQHRTALHIGQHRAGNQVRRARPRDQHCADHNVGLLDRLFDCSGGGKTGDGAALEHLVKLAQARQRTVKNLHRRAQPHRHARRLSANHPAAEHHHARRDHAGHPAHQSAAPAGIGPQGERPRLNREPARHFAHRSEQGQAAAGASDGFIGNRRNARLHQAARLIGIGRQMQVGEQDLPFAQLHPFAGLRFLDLHHHIGAGEDFGGAIDHFGPGLAVGVIILVDAQPSAGFNDHPVPGRRIFAHRFGGETDAELARLDFLGNADQHDSLLAMQRKRR